jgi:hypothetical protein
VSATVQDEKTNFLVLQNAIFCNYIFKRCEETTPLKRKLVCLLTALQPPKKIGAWCRHRFKLLASEYSGSDDNLHVNNYVKHSYILTDQNIATGQQPISIDKLASI